MTTPTVLGPRIPRWAARASALTLVVLLLGIPCATAGDGGQLTESERAEVETAVTTAVESFRAAQVARDVEAIRDSLWPEFHMLQDGRRAAYAAVVEQIEQTMGDISRLETEWRDVRVQALAPHLALASFTFSDAITTASGEVLRLDGETTLVWEERGGEWRLLYADSDHYPPSGS